MGGRPRSINTHRTRKYEAFDSTIHRLAHQFEAATQVDFCSYERISLEGAGQNSRQVNYRLNTVGLEKPRYVVLRPQITRYHVLSRIGIHIEGQDLLSRSSQDATDFTPYVPACAGHYNQPFTSSGSHALILCRPSFAINSDTQHVVPD
jgi:hypothetical protein